MASAYQNQLWAQTKKEAKQDLDYSKWQRDYQANQLQNSVINRGLSTGLSRSSIGQGMVGQGMIPINKEYSMATQNYNNALARLALQQKYAGGGGARPKADPTQSTQTPAQTGAVIDYNTGKIYYPSSAYSNTPTYAKTPTASQAAAAKQPTYPAARQRFRYGY